MLRKMVFMLVLLTLATVLMSLPRNLVVVEIGTGTWCPYCPGAAMGADDLVHNNHPVAIIENHNGDSYANTFSNARNSYYGITGYPTAFFDGLNPSVGGSSTQSLYSGYLTKVNQRMQVQSRYTISATGVMTGNNFNIEVEVAKPEADTNTGVVLHVVLTESGIVQNWQGQTHLNFVTRLMVPNQNGTPISLATGQNTTIPLSFTWNPAWSLAQGEIVLFLQNVSTKEILQGIKYSLPGLIGAYPVSHTDISFPDTYVTGTTTVPVTITNFISNPASGTISINNPAFTSSVSTFNVAGLGSTTFNVSFNPTAAQQYNGVMTITSNLHQNNLIAIPLSGLAFLNAAPVANDVVISGPPVVYQDMEAAYSFSDSDGDTEGETQFQWMRIINNNPVPITGAIYYMYRVAEEDLGFRVAVQVTPKDMHGMPGTPVLSNYSAEIEVLPAPRNLTAVVVPPSTVTLSWERPEHFEGRGFVGYRVYRNGLAINSTANPANTTFTDTYVPIGTHEYWVCSLFNNPMMISDPSNILIVNVGVANDDLVQPLQNLSVYPNPFNTSTSFNVASKAGDKVQVQIYNLKGQMIVSMPASTDTAGNAEIVWNGQDSKGIKVQSGLYLYKVNTPSKTYSGKILLNK